MRAKERQERARKGGRFVEGVGGLRRGGRGQRVKERKYTTPERKDLGQVTSVNCLMV